MKTLRRSGRQFQHRSRLTRADTDALSQASVTVEDLTHDGRGVARYQGKTVFISGALPGERVNVQFTQHKSQYSEAKLLSVEVTSPDRVVPSCSHAHVCGGCQLAHLSIAAQLIFKQQQVERSFSKIGDIHLPWQAPLLGDAWHYRRRTRWLVNRQGQLCYRALGGKNAVVIKDCQQLIPRLQVLMQQLQQDLPQLGQAAIDEIELVSIGQDNLTLFVNQHWTVKLEQSWMMWCQTQGVAGLVVDQPHQRHLPRKVLLATELTYSVAGYRLSLDVDQFIQVQEKVNAQLVDTAVDWLALSKQSYVVELFAGSGNFSLALAAASGQYLGLELSETSVASARANALTAGLEGARFAQADLFDGQWLCPLGVTHALLDPPRDGALLACQQLVKQKSLQTIVYVSCHPATLARDAAILKQAGFRLVRLALAEQFSQTYHVEVISLWQRQ